MIDDSDDDSELLPRRPPKGWKPGGPAAQPADPLGVPLGQLDAMLQAMGARTTRQGPVLTVQHQHYSARIEVVPAEQSPSPAGPIRAAIRLTAELPPEIQTLFKEPEATAGFNQFASLGALTADRGPVYIGSRLTLFEGDDKWSTLYRPLLVLTPLFASNGILGALRRSMTREAPRGGASEWTERDLERVRIHLSRQFVCTPGGLGLTAEFGLTPGATTAALGHDTALFEMQADQPHPEVGGGLLCLLQLPHRFPDRQTLQRMCTVLNSLEMSAVGFAPHFGAWCEGRSGANPAYVTFLPNAAHPIEDIATNAALWAAHRARLANATLASFGISA